MENLIADFHIHSKYSHDSLMSPESIVRRAKKVGLTCIAITDHGTIRGGVEARKFEKKYGVKVITGAEIKTDSGDIIGLNLDDEIHATEWHDVILAIRAQGGSVVLPHPYRDHRKTEEIARSVDFIEIWNSRCTTEENSKARDLAQITSKKHILGSDAHCLSEIGLVKVGIIEEPYKIQEVMASKRSPSWEIKKSQIISHLKKGEIATLIFRGGRYLWKGRT